MSIIPFGEYLPDLPALGNPGATVAKNVIPHLAGYKPLSSLVTFSDALTARCQGAFSAIDSAGVTNVYSGDATSLYRLTDVTWTDASQSGGYNISSDQAWNFVRWNNDVFATNVAEENPAVPIHKKLAQTMARLVDESTDDHVMSGLVVDKYEY